MVLSNFNKKQADIKSYMDMWLYLFRYMEELDEKPEFLDNRVFELIFDIGKVANLITGRGRIRKRQEGRTCESRD